MKKILVVGDSMLDCYWFGDAIRLSPEAPVPIVRYRSQEVRAGAAANVLMNCKAMGADASLLSVVGKDDAANQIEEVICSKLISDQNSSTTVKMRLIAKQQQITRFDFDYTTSDEAALRLKQEFFYHYKFADIIIFSDYGKGALKYVQEMISVASEAEKIVLVDPKGHRFDKYSGATLIKPNMDEAKEMVGGWDSDGELADKMHRFMQHGKFKYVLLTMAGDGMTLFSATDQVHVGSTARSIFDVTGAGDTALAAFAVSLARGNDFVKSVEYATIASGIVVGKFGTAIATESEVFGG